MTSFDIPTGTGIPLVDLSTDRLPDPTMDAIRNDVVGSDVADARYAPPAGFVAPGSLTWGVEHRSTTDPIYGNILLGYAIKWTPTTSGTVAIWPGRQRSLLGNTEDQAALLYFSATQTAVPSPILGSSNLFGTFATLPTAPPMPPVESTVPSRGAFSFVAGTTYLVMIISIYAADKIGKTVDYSGILHSLNARGGFTNAQLPSIPPVLPYRTELRGGSSVAITDQEPVTNITGTGANSIAIGGATATTTDNIAIGRGASASTGLDAIALGRGAQATWQDALAIGRGAIATSGNRGVAIGVTSKAQGGDSVAVGPSAEATGNLSMALGFGSKATTPRSTVLQSGGISDVRASVTVASDGGNPLFKMAQTQEWATAWTVNAADTVNELCPLPDDTINLVKLRVVGRRKNSDVAKVIEGTCFVEKIDGTVRIIGTPTYTTLAQDAGAAAWSLLFSSTSSTFTASITVDVASYWSMHFRIEELRAPMSHV